MTDRKRSTGILPFGVLACGATWALAAPAAMAWLHHRAPAPFAVACAGLSAFGPLLAALAVGKWRGELGELVREIARRWWVNPAWMVVALAALPLVHTLARSLFACAGGHPARWFAPPGTPEQLAALVVFPLGEEFGWRGFAYPRFVERLGGVRGPLALGLLWGLWHLAYAITPAAAAFDVGELAMTMVELPLYSLILAWLFERAGRSMAVALAFHAGAHLDHLERAARVEPLLLVAHSVVLVGVAGAAAWALAKPMAPRPR